ncbi:ABC transporter permease [Nonomuraea typhae]|uniref:ABC transporter permease n=1 Tax=Nonomuraea typhae TaxID=2603600 RepID=UPI0012FCBE6B|nr:ABC transporter permease [Nonomuraea typhae]
MKPALHAEWTKLRTSGGIGWLLLALVALTAGVSAAACATVSCTAAPCAYDVPKLSLMGVQAGQAIVVVVAVLAIGGEYSTGMIGLTLVAMPRRITLLAAKATVLTGVTLAAGTAAVLASVLAGRLILPGNGFTPAHGQELLSLADGPTLRAAMGSVLYLALIALLSLGIAVAVRDSAAAVGVVLGLIYVLGVLPFLISDPDAQLLLWRISPMNAGLAVQATADLSALPLGPWAGLGVLAVWAAVSMLGGGLLLRARDA